MKRSSSTSRSYRRALTLALPLGLLLAACDPAPPAPTATTTAPTVTAAPTATTAAAAPTTTATATAAPTATADAQPERQIAGAAHILIAYKGAQGAPKKVTRSADEAKKRAEEALKKLKENKGSFDDLVKEYSDDEASRPANGMLGNFERNVMPPAFSDATFAMEVGAVSDVVETARGFHIIKRTK